jgi:hypothetical protein
MNEDDRDQDLVAATLASAPPPEVSPAFLARVNARIDAENQAGWFGLLDFRAWTLRLAPIAAAIAIVALLWPDAALTPTPDPAPVAIVTTAADTFTPSSEDDWQQDVSANALLEAALDGGSNAR